MPITKESLSETLHLDDLDHVIERVKALIHEGNIRRLIVKDRDGVTLVEIPLTLGVVGAVLVPVWAVLGAIAGIAAEATVLIEKRDTAE